ncbi:uncharacterized protein [Pleurodeles waltl]|uniref:uncharacterized protein n=1 Tax=Pleurodeles waltl TaxID=8319 RepID=UPI00370959C8
MAQVENDTKTPFLEYFQADLSYPPNETAFHLLDLVADCTPTQNTRCACRGGFTCRTPPAAKDTCDDCRKIKACGPGQGVLKKATPWVDTQCQACPESTFSNITDSISPCLNHTQCSALGLVVKSSGTATNDTLCTHPPPPGLSTALWCLSVVLPVAIIFITVALIFLLIRRKRRVRKGPGDSYKNLQFRNRALLQNKTPLLASEKTETTRLAPFLNGGLELPVTKLTNCSPPSPLVVAENRVPRWSSAVTLDMPPSRSEWGTSVCSLCQPMERDSVSETRRANPRLHCSCSSLMNEYSDNFLPSNKKRHTGNLASSGILLLGISQAQIASLPMKDPPESSCQRESQGHPILMCDLVAPDSVMEKTRVTETNQDLEDGRSQKKEPPAIPPKPCRLPPRLQPQLLDAPANHPDEDCCQNDIKDTLQTDGMSSPPLVTMTASERCPNVPTLVIQSCSSDADLPRELRSTGEPEENLETQNRNSQQPEEDEWRG